MRGTAIPGQKVEVELNKLGDSQRQMFETLIIENNVKFTRNKTDGRYVALLKMDKDALSANNQKSTKAVEKASVSPRVQPRIDYTTHTTCQEDFLGKRSFSPYKDKKHATREIKTKAELGIEAAKMASTGPHSSRAIKIDEGKTVNIARSLVIEPYKEVFPNVEIDKILFTPVHISYPFLTRRMELFYNTLFAIVLRNKSLESVSLPRAISEYYEKEYRDSVNYYHQNLVNLLYSGNKQSDRPEVATFMAFLADKPGSLPLLWHLFVRQLVKAVTGNFLLKLDGQDPSKIIIQRSHAQDIVTQALYFDEEAKSQALQDLSELIGGGKGVLYYEFLEMMLNQRLKLEVR